MIMIQSDPSTAASIAAPEELRDSSCMEAREIDLLRNALGKIAPMLDHRTAGDPGTGVRGQRADEALSPATSASHRQALGDVSRLLDLPRSPARRMPATTLHALQEWEGHVVEIGDGEFTAWLIDITAGASHEQEEAIIPLANIPDSDAARMREGSVFRWVIGHERSAAGTKKLVSRIVFRDLPAVTKADLRDGEAWARRMTRALGP